ncbi:hypothetical protein CSKR_112437 [Clonorchis sinensis]|uniref:Uncharacterized protein n=1 Tax=Clonorchis sinensis TaxID=79923 RepID=A0A3R7JRU6_CLOSI|nr:hypothetical protein CSKR_112437 [Clonorchis sinensis]
MRTSGNKTSTMRDNLIRRPVIKCPAVASFWCPAVLQPEGSTRARIIPDCPGLDRGNREAEVAFEPGPRPCVASYSWGLHKTDRQVEQDGSLTDNNEETPGQPGIILALVLPSGSMAARHRKGVTAERFCIAIARPCLYVPPNMRPQLSSAA